MKLRLIAFATCLGLSLSPSCRSGSPWESAIADFERQDAKAPPPRGAYLFVGSSSIRKWESLARDFPGRVVINRGFGGSQLSDVVFFADRIILPYEPRQIIVYCGDNDIASGHKSPADVLAELQQLVAKVRARLPHTPLAYIAMKPAPSTWAEYGAKMRAGNELIRAYIAADATLSYIDVFTPMLGADGAPRPELFEPDREHLNATGYALWAKLVGPQLD